MEKRSSARAEESERTRNEILRVALELFAEQGYAETSISDIVEAADTYRSAIEWHFGGKGGLLLEVIEYYLEVEFQKDFEQAWAEYEKEHPGPWPEQAFNFFFPFMRQTTQNRLHLLMALFTLTFEQLHKNTALAQKIRGFWNTFTLIMRNAIEMGQDQGVFRKEIDPLWTAKSILALGQGLFMQWYIDPEKADVEKLFHEMELVTIRLLYPESSASNTEPEK